MNIKKKKILTKRHPSPSVKQGLITDHPLTIHRRDGRFDHLNFSLNIDGFFHYSFPLKTYERILLSTSFRDGSVVENLKLKVLTLSPIHR